MSHESAIGNQMSALTKIGFHKIRKPIGKALLILCFFPFLFTATEKVSAASYGLPPVPAGHYIIVLKESHMKAFVRSTLHDFETLIPKFSGTLTLPKRGVLSKVRFNLEFPTADLDTGNFLRNKAMRDKALEVEKFPKAKFDAKIIKFIRKTDAEWEYEITGVLSIHGIEREITVPVKVQDESGKIIVTAQFLFSLATHKISPPGLLFIKVEDKVELTVRLSFRKQ